MSNISSELLLLGASLAAGASLGALYDLVWLLRLELAARCHDGAGVRRVLRQAQAAGVWFDGQARRTLAFWQQEAAG